MNKRHVLISLGLTTVGALAGFGWKTVLAEGIPTLNPLYYSGTLTEGGALVTGTRALTVNLWPDATSAGMPLCQTVASGALVSGGRFRIALAGLCKALINQNANVYVEVIDGATSLGRSPIGAVPYAVEADHAVNATIAAYALDAGHANTADNATSASGAAGTLETRLAALESALPGKSAFLAHQAQTQYVLSGQGASVLFDQKDFDLANEFSTASNFFTSKTGGLYDVSCRVEWKIVASGAATAYFQTSIFVNQNTASGIQQDFQGDGYFATVEAHGIVKLSSNDTLTCQAYQNSGTTLSLQNDPVSVNRFSAIRISP